VLLVLTLSTLMLLPLAMNTCTTLAYQSYILSFVFHKKIFPLANVDHDSVSEASQPLDNLLLKRLERGIQL
jgi:hypothetical protein